LSNSSGTSYFPFETSGSGFESQFAYSAYASRSSLGIDGLGLLGLGDLAQGAVGNLWDAARTAVGEHFTARGRERRREQIARWKENGIYPDKGDPTNGTERAERAALDVVAGTLVNTPRRPRGKRNSPVSSCATRSGTIPAN